MENVNDKNRKLIKALELIGDYELMKPIDKIDGDLIDATVDWSLRLQNKDITLSTEEIEKMVSMIPFKNTDELDETNGEALNQRKVLKKNKVLFIAAVITILVTLLTIVSVAFEWNIFEELKNRFGKVANTPVNEEMVVDGITVVMHGEYRDYTDIEEALKSENINVLYPTELPDGIILEKVVFYQENGYNKIAYILNDENITIELFLSEDIHSIIGDLDFEKHLLGKYECYICDMKDIIHTEVCFIYDNNVYLVSGKNKQALIEIIKNLKELE